MHVSAAAAAATKLAMHVLKFSPVVDSLRLRRRKRFGVAPVSHEEPDSARQQSRPNRTRGRFRPRPNSAECRIRPRTIPAISSGGTGNPRRPTCSESDLPCSSRVGSGRASSPRILPEGGRWRFPRNVHGQVHSLAKFTVETCLTKFTPWPSSPGQVHPGQVHPPWVRLPYAGCSPEGAWPNSARNVRGQVHPQLETCMARFLRAQVHPARFTRRPQTRPRRRAAQGQSERGSIITSPHTRAAGAVEGPASPTRSRSPAGVPPAGTSRPATRHRRC